MSFAAIKLIHLGCIVTSYLMFVLRGFWSVTGSTLLQRSAAKVVPHVVDTLLLASAITLAVMLGISPLNTPWLLTKITALLLYIALGSIAIRRGRTRRTRLAAWIAAQLVFLLIVAIAITHSPLPWLQGT